MTTATEKNYPQPQDGEIPRFSGLPTFFRLPFAPQAAELDIGIVGVPWDGGTTNRAGTRHGPRELRNASSLVRRIHQTPRRSPYDYARVGDMGDVRINPVDMQDSLARIEAWYHALNQQQVMPLTAGGDHLTTLPILRALGRNKPLGMIHFDAHTDLREDYLGVKLSHACVIRRCWELAGEGRIHQFGIRSGEREEFLFGKEHTDLHAFTFDGLAEVLDSLKDTPVYFTVDLDVMDPSVFPGTGTPEPGGVSFDELRKA